MTPTTMNTSSRSTSPIPALGSNTNPHPSKELRLQPPRPPEHGRRTSLKTSRSYQKHQEYLDKLLLPSPEILQQISSVQQRKEADGFLRRTSEDVAGPEHERARAAALIQRNYRGYRERRALNGLTLDPSTRWTEAFKEARYRNLTTPRAKGEIEEKVRRSFDSGVRRSSWAEGTEVVMNDVGTRRHSASLARQNWKKIGIIAKRAGGDEDSDTSENASGSERDGNETDADKERAEWRRKRLEQKVMRQKAAKIMDLQYFLEMVDLKHRYGSNLRTYHEEWRKSDTKENFFYWLDYGEGRYIDCRGCPREKLDREQVRYLSKEERLHYLVKIDKEGRMCWAKNGARIDTTMRYKDSIHGIVPDTDTTPAYTPAAFETATELGDGGDSSSSSSENLNPEGEYEDFKAERSAIPGLNEAKGVRNVRYISAATIFNKLLRSSVQKNTWIFVADTHFRLYVGIKQSGAFQHSSFLHGSRISAAGLVKVKNGLLKKLSPLSGHYRPPVANFRAFVHSLKDAGVDMSHVTISRSYAMLIGLEAYIKTTKKSKKMVRKMVHHNDNILSPEQELGQMEKRDTKERDTRIKEVRAKALGNEAIENKEHTLIRKLHIGSRHGASHASVADSSNDHQ